MTNDQTATPRLTLTIDVTDLPEQSRIRFTEQVTDLLSEYRDDDEAAPVAVGWTSDTLQEALTELERDGSWVQAGVIRKALDNGGTVSRDEVYKIGAYEPDRMLRGFTRPVNRIVNRMRARGAVAASAADLLKPTYQNGVQADGFRVPAELVGLIG